MDLASMKTAKRWTHLERRQSEESQGEEGGDGGVRGRLSQAHRSGRGLGADRGGKARSRESIRRQQQERRHEAEAA